MSVSRKLLLGAIDVAALGANAEQSRHGRDAGEPGRFDYYAVALSWSPAFCATHDDPNQCASGRQAGFVLHGLWPQYEQGLSAGMFDRAAGAAGRGKNMRRCFHRRR